MPDQHFNKLFKFLEIVNSLKEIVIALMQFFFNCEITSMTSHSNKYIVVVHLNFCHDLVSMHIYVSLNENYSGTLPKGHLISHDNSETIVSDTI